MVGRYAWWAYSIAPDGISIYSQGGVWLGFLSSDYFVINIYSGSHTIMALVRGESIPVWVIKIFV